MKKILVLLFVVALAGLSLPALAQKQAPPEGGPPKPFTVPAKQSFSLPNGLRVTMVPYGTVPKVSILAVVRAGNINEPEEQVWLADFTGDLMKEGTKSRSSEQVAREAASMGGRIGLSVGEDETRASLDVLSEFGPKAVALLGDFLQNPLFPASEVQRLKTDRLRSLSIQKTQPQSLAQERFSKVLYPGHPYGRVFPTEAMIQKFTGEDAQRFYKENFGAARTHIYVAGQFDPAAMKKAVTDAFTAWPHGPEAMIDIPKPVFKRTLELVEKPNAAQSTLYIGLPVVDPSHPDYIQLMVMDSLLGGSFGSRITANIREQKGYTYSPFSQVSTHYRSGYWAEIADVTTAVTGPSMKEIFGEIERLQKEAPPNDELQSVQNYMSGIFVLQNSSRNGVIAQLAYVDLHQLGDSYLSTFVQKLNAVTPQQVQDMAKKYLQTDRMTMVVVGDRQKIADQIAPFETKEGGK